MSALSFKSFALTAALGVAAVFTAGASANAASPVSAPALSTQAHGAVVDVDYRGRHHQRFDRRPNRGPACSAQNARVRAQRMGIRNVRVVHRGRFVQVRGFRHGRPVSISFANARGCPIIR